MYKNVTFSTSVYYEIKTQIRESFLFFLVLFFIIYITCNAYDCLLDLELLKLKWNGAIF